MRTMGLLWVIQLRGRIAKTMGSRSVCNLQSYCNNNIIVGEFSRYFAVAICTFALAPPVPSSFQAAQRRQEDFLLHPPVHPLQPGGYPLYPTFVRNFSTDRDYNILFNQRRIFLPHDGNSFKDFCGCLSSETSIANVSRP
jgi:hypothetical protein